MLAIYDVVYDILLFAKRNLDPQCLKGFMRLLFKHCVIKVFINEVVWARAQKHKLEFW